MPRRALLSGEQSKAARALLSWSRVRLAARAHISEPTILDFENGSRNPNPVLPRSARPWRMRELSLALKGHFYLAPWVRTMIARRTIECGGGGRRNARSSNLTLLCGEGLSGWYRANR
ncbi:helix-turn-helix transcriptional regulator [Mesorhizobium sp. WSM4887]|uniref:helix-turn-helix domain-containing protein n=1 Tax=Mesorhizobium sp. WSM4887 TaxID=3038543 RepID=UPI002417D036|nr:helix-turn-helix transcriptional regulator [Mesorhizobium sp. WSM4887]MDG4889580.1 helix-turn-helix transcriptional regulator [Mesorhizobium sp. WSM4887]